MAFSLGIGVGLTDIPVAQGGAAGPNPPSALYTTFTSADASFDWVGGDTTFTVTVKDAEDAPIVGLPSNRFSFTGASGLSIVPDAGVTDGDGVLTFTVTAAGPDTYPSIGCVVSGVTVDDTVELTVTGDPPVEGGMWTSNFWTANFWTENFWAAAP